MSKQARRRQHRHSVRGQAQPASTTSTFTPVPVRPRHDGWTPMRQVAFVRALAGSACIEEACAAVGMSPRSYYDLRARPDAGSFRQAVDLALDVGTHRLADAMLSRAIHGEVTPIFYKGEQVGERRRFDNQLGMFLLRARQPERYGKWRDRAEAYREDPDGAAKLYAQAVRNLAGDVTADATEQPRPARPPLRASRLARGDERPAYCPPPQFDPAELAAHCERLEALAAELEANPGSHPAGREDPEVPPQRACE